MAPSPLSSPVEGEEMKCPEGLVFESCNSSKIIQPDQGLLREFEANLESTESKPIVVLTGDAAGSNKGSNEIANFVSWREQAMRAEK